MLSRGAGQSISMIPVKINSRLAGPGPTRTASMVCGYHTFRTLSGIAFLLTSRRFLVRQFGSVAAGEAGELSPVLQLLLLGALRFYSRQIQRFLAGRASRRGLVQ